MKKGEKGLKNAFFWVINFNKFQQHPAAYLFVGNDIKTGKKALKCIFLGHKLQKFSRGGLPTPPAVGRGFVYLFVRNYIKKRGKSP